IDPDVVILPTEPPVEDSVNQRLPSGPAVISMGWVWLAFRLYSVKVLEVVTLAILFAERSVNQIRPSGPSAKLVVPLSFVGTAYSTMPVGGIQRFSRASPWVRHCCGCGREPAPRDVGHAPP